MASYFVLGSDNREYGPVSIDVLKQWFGEGRLVADTQLREENSPTWKPSRDFPEVAEFVLPRFKVALPPTPFVPPAPALSEGPEELDSLPNSDYRVEIGAWLSQSWKLYLSDWGQILGYTLLTIVLQFAASMVPCVGWLSALFVNPMLQVGLVFYLLKKKRSQSTELTDLFVGFKHFYVPSLVGALLLFLIVLAILIPVGVTVAAVVFLGHVSKPGDLQTFQWIALGGVLLVTVVVLCYLNVVFAFWYGLIPDKGLGGWEALQTSRRLASKHWLKLLAYGIVVLLLTMAGFLACIIGILFTIPFACCCYVTAYEEIFGRRTSSTLRS